MKKNILIIGYGNIARRLDAILCKDTYEIYGISRSKKKGLENFIEWDWLSKKIPKLECKNYESIVFIPKPSNSYRSGYQDGFLNSSKNLFNFLEVSQKISYKKFITISSTSVYGYSSDRKGNMEYRKGNMEYRQTPPPAYFADAHMLKEEDSDGSPLRLGGYIITEYEKNQIKRYAERLIVLRLSGLYTSKPKSKNHLHRDNAAKIIKFFIENDFNFTSHEIFNCTEDSNSFGDISNEKLKKLGFIFNRYN
tara:strand:+ start:15 stop:767 length:753 start_codon:yes stop_codon:yes gene_type:complete